jgi:hypothetical protein
MKMPEHIGMRLWSAAIGAVALAVVGFTWGGWVTGGTAARDVAAATRSGTIAALAPICAERFRGQADAPLKTAELMKSGSWERGGIVAKSGFATSPGTASADSDVASACALLLTAPPVAKN